MGIFSDWRVVLLAVIDESVDFRLFGVKLREFHG